MARAQQRVVGKARQVRQRGGRERSCQAGCAGVVVGKGKVTQQQKEE